MASQQVWLKVELEKGKLNPLRAIKGLIIKEEDFVHAQKGDYLLHVRHPAPGVRGKDCYCSLELYHKGKRREIFTAPEEYLENMKFIIATRNVM